MTLFCTAFVIMPHKPRAVPNGGAGMVVFEAAPVRRRAVGRLVFLAGVLEVGQVVAVAALMMMACR